MTPKVVPATDALLAQIEVWLDVEEAAYKAASDAPSDMEEAKLLTRGFRCNWVSALRHWREYGSPIDVLLVGGDPVGFLVGMDILEIRPDMRRRGYGNILANYMVDRAYDEGYSVIQIEIAPISAEPFWRQMGFTPVPGRIFGGAGIYAYRILRRKAALGNGKRVGFRIGFYSEYAKFNDGAAPFYEVCGEAERLPDGSLRLPERVIAFQPELAERHDNLVRIEIEGTPIYFDKVKYPEAKALGIQRDPGDVYFIEQVSASPNKLHE